jgi:hypothetical protein
MEQDVSKRMKRKTRAKQKLIMFEVPPDLYRAVKAEVRSHGITFRDWINTQMRDLLREGPLWRAFLREQADRPEANERGALGKIEMPPCRLEAQDMALSRLEHGFKSRRGDQC